jgi:hypothetical protein
MPRATGESCYICGRPDARTRDHIFPEQLFEPPRPQLLTAPACESCQRQLQPDEDYFRIFVASGAYGDPVGQRMWDGPIARSFDRRPAIRARLASAITSQELHSPGGVYLGELTGLLGERDRIASVLRKMVRGLYRLETGTNMPPDTRSSSTTTGPVTQSNRASSTLLDRCQSMS